MEENHRAVYRPRCFPESTSISVRQDGKWIWRGKCASDPKLLAEVILKRAPQAKRIVFETATITGSPETGPISHRR